MKRLLQTDPRWKDAKIGNTKLTLNRFGCLITSISMATDYYQFWKRPDWLASILTFTPGGLLYWSSVTQQLRLTTLRGHGVDNRRVDAALANPDEVALLEVPLGRASHWVVATRAVPWNKEYFIADPLVSSLTRTTAAYGGYTGFCILSRKIPTGVSYVESTEVE